MKSFSFFISLLITILIGCKSKEVASTNNLKSLIENGYTIGTVLDKSETDGCRFVISINDSTTFEPLNLGGEHQTDKLKIAFKYRLSRAMTVCMMGKPISLSEVKKIE